MVPRATVRTLKPKNLKHLKKLKKPKNLKTFLKPLGFYQPCMKYNDARLTL